MSDRAISGAWAYRMLYLALATGLLVLSLTPIPPLWHSLPPPDILACLTCAWVLRRPEYLPPLLVAAVVLLADFLQQRPPGLWAAIMVVLVVALSGRVARVRELPFASEWLLVAIALLVAVLVNRVALYLVLGANVPIGAVLLQYSFTLAAYPVVVLLSNVVFRVQKLPPGSDEMLGREA